MVDDKPPRRMRSSLLSFFPAVDLVISALVAPSLSSVSL
jgi:hypothetical protein